MSAKYLVKKTHLAPKYLVFFFVHVCVGVANVIWVLKLRLKSISGGEDEATKELLSELQWR